MEIEELKDLVIFNIGDGLGNIIVDMIENQEEEATDLLVRAFEEGKSFIGISNIGLGFHITSQNPEVIIKIIELANLIKEEVEDFEDVLRLAFVFKRYYGDYLNEEEFMAEDIIEVLKQQIPEEINEVSDIELQGIAEDSIWYTSINFGSRFIDWEACGEEWLSNDFYTEVVRLIESVSWTDEFPMDIDELTDEVADAGLGDGANTLETILNEWINSLDNRDGVEDFISDMEYVIETLDYYERYPGVAFEEMVDDIYRDMGELMENIPVVRHNFDYEEYLEEYLEDYGTEEESGLGIILLYVTLPEHTNQNPTEIWVYA
jgi:hypothetical protein